MTVKQTDLFEDTAMNENTNSTTAETSAKQDKGQRATIALSILVHGEAVRFNRGKTRGDDFDFKYMSGPGGPYPYVSSQCFKKYWRESLPTTPSPITREKNARGEEKNQAYTSGNPFEYVDDDLFGYMIAGAGEEAAEEGEGEGEEEVAGVEAVDEKLAALQFSSESVRDAKKLFERFHEDKPLSRYLVQSLGADARELYDAAPADAVPSAEVVEAMLSALNKVLEDADFYDKAGLNANGAQRRKLQGGKVEDVMEINRELLLRAFSRELAKEEKKKRATTRRTAPVRMHALVAFSGVRTAKDFQTFSRDVALTGKNSILNPNPVGIYSGWLKSRVLIEAYRIGKFYIGPNLDILEDQAQGQEKSEEVNPYDRAKAKVGFVQLTPEQRRQRLGLLLQALADVGNNQGPASGALHDGSLKPKAFIGAVVNCADSPFDSVWQGTAEHPRLDLHRLQAVLEDWSDLFLDDKRVYVGLPIETLSQEEEGATKEAVEKTIRDAGFVPVVGTPRKTLLQFAKEAPTIAIP